MRSNRVKAALWGLAFLLLTCGTALADRGPVPEFTPEDIFFWEDTGGSLAASSSAKNAVVGAAGSAAIAAYGDRFDFFLLFTTFTPADGPSQSYTGGRNYTLGLGTPDQTGTAQFDRNQSLFGLATKRLRGVTSMWDLWSGGHRSRTASVLGQEYIHSAGIYLGTFPDGVRSFEGDGSTCGRAAHWNYRLDAQGSSMEIREWEGGPLTRTGPTADDPVLVGNDNSFNKDIPGSVYSYPDLYLFGVVTADEMDTRASELRYMDDDGSGTCSTPHTGNISSWSSADIINSLDPVTGTVVGPRRPSADKEQKDLASLIIVVYPTGAFPTAEDQDRIADITNTLMENWHLSTLGRSTMRTTLPRDCNANGIEDETDIDVGGFGDCNANRVPDVCESPADCNANGQQDICEIGPGQNDCNANDVPDDCDIASGTSADSPTDGIPDECQSPVLHVDRFAGGAGHGTSWADAYTGLQRALRVAASPDAAVEEIWVAQGMYRPTGDGQRWRAFYLLDGVGIYGGFDGSETMRSQRDPIAHQTILSGDLANDDGVGFTNIADNSRHVVVADGVGPGAVLDGFTIRGGYADGVSYDGDGAGMNVYDADPTVRNVRFESNRAVGGGAGLAMHYDSEPVIDGCAFEGNQADGSGGALAVLDSTPTITASNFTGNSGANGGAINISGVSSGTLVSGSVFQENQSSSSGGAILANGGAARIERCRFVRNTAGSSGGGLAILGAGSEVADSIFVANTAANGGGISLGADAPLRGVTVAYNIATNFGGGLIMSGGVTPDAVNSIFYLNQPEQILGGATNVGFTYCRVGSTVNFPGTGNIVATNLFLANPSPGPDGTWDGVDDDLGDLRLAPGGAAVDAGDSGAVAALVTTDTAGLPRIADVTAVADTGAGGYPVVDMGAHESPGDGSDGDGDGFEDGFDNCPGVVNADQMDADEDGIGDACDTCTDTDGDGKGDAGYAANTCPTDACPGFNDAADVDGDGVPNACDNCPGVSNGPQADGDGDGIGIACDNCPVVPNPGQEDCNGDGQGDACDPDLPQRDPDGDGVCSAVDVCPTVWNPSQEDCNGDGEGDLCEPSVGQQDPDGDGLCNNTDTCDGIPEDVLNGADTDGDGLRDICDPCPDPSSVDADGDGICDEKDLCPGFDDGSDVDADGVPDGCDDDDDGDFTVDGSDCASLDATAFAAPGEVAVLAFVDANTLTWTDTAAGFGSGTRYDIVRGAISQLPVGSGAAEICVVQGGTGSAIVVPGIPAVGTGTYYLVRMGNACADGPWGTDSLGSDRVFTGCD